MGQFMLEAFIIVGFASLIGFLSALILIKLLSLLPPSVEEVVGVPTVDLSVAVAAAALLSVIGFLAGYFPARKASRLEVVDCLRH